MKKHLLNAFVIVFTILIFASCGNSRQSSQGNEQKSSESSQQIGDVIDMSLVTSGGVFQKQAITENGCYEIYSHVDGHGKLFFYDFENRTISFVTNQETPTDDETNPGWISDLMGGVTPVAAGDSLYLFKLGGLPLPSENFPGFEKYIIKMDFDGTNREKISLSSWQEFNTGGIAFDGKYLYFVVNEYYDGGEALEQYHLCRANFDNMQLEVICELGNEDTYSLVDVYDDGLVFQRFHAIGTTIDEYNMEVPLLESHVMLYSLVENKLVDADIPWKNGSLSCVFDSHSKIYYVEPDSPKLSFFDIKTGESTVVCENLNVDSLAMDAIYVGGSIIDNHIPFSITVSDSEDFYYIRYFYDLDTGDIVKVSFDDTTGLEAGGMYIVGETEKEFFVCMGGRYVTTTKTSKSNDSYTFDELIYEYAMISKEDYWSSVPNFEPFEDFVHVR
jgi:hypothetical protein